MIVKILGFVDFLGAFIFLLLIFDTQLPFQFILFPAFLLFIKGLFILFGDLLSLIDLASALILVLSIFFTLGSVFLWIPFFLLLGKGVVSFL
jgi:hypothetical protein